MDRYARNRATRGFGFFGACGTFFFRFLRLTLMAAVGYWVLFRFVHDWLFDDVYVWATRDFTVERTAFGVRMLLYLLFVILLSFYNMLIDYARIRAVVEDRRSMIGTLAAGLRFVRNRPTSAIGLYAANGAILLSIVAVYGLLAPGAGGAGPAVWAVFLGTQAYIVARLASKLLFYASQTALFQSEFAVAGYVVAASPGPPEPPAAEAIGTPDEASVQGAPGPTQW